MPQRKIRLFLPLAAGQASALMEDMLPGIQSLGLPQLVSILLLQGLAEGDAAADPEQLLARLLEVALPLGQEGFALLVRERFRPDLFARGLEQLEQLGISLLDEHEVEEADYLLSDGRWDFAFCRRQRQRISPMETLYRPDGSRHRLSHQQARLYRVFLAEPDESMHVQGLAGVGKTHLIRAMVETLPHGSTLLLAFTQAQLGALQRRLGGLQVQGMTFEDMAGQLLSRDQTQPWRRSGPRRQLTWQVTDQQVVEQLGIQSVAGHAPEQVVRWCRNAVRVFCDSTALSIGPEHFARECRSFARADQAAMLGYACMVWREILRPSQPGLQMPVRAHHLIKQLALEPGLRLSAGFSHVIVDESHDLSPALQQFLGRCQQVVYTLGDVAQAMHGKPPRTVRQVRQRELSHSIRAGRGLESVVNPVLQAIPDGPPSLLEGNRELDTRVLCFDQPQIPDEPTTILVNSEWGLFEWFQRLASAKASFALLPGVNKRFRAFVLDCIELYRHGIRPRHPSLYRFESWAAMQQEFSGLRAFQRIDGMLGRGYSSSDFEQAMLQMQSFSRARIRLGRVVDARNLEMDSVMLTQDLLTPLVGQDVMDLRASLSAIYVGATRSRYRLHIPGELLDWVGDQSRALRR